MGEGSGSAALGAAVARLREAERLSQADLAELMRAQGVNWRREQVLRVEADARQVSVHEAAVLAYVLGRPLGVLLSLAGYPEHLLRTVVANTVDDMPPTTWPAGAAERTKSPRVREHMRGGPAGTLLGGHAVEHLLGVWQDYERRSGRPPSERATRAKRASLWSEYEADPEAFVDRALGPGKGVLLGLPGAIEKLLTLPR